MSKSFAAGAVVYAKDATRVAAFYAAVAGLREVQAEPDHVILEASQFQLVVLAVPSRIASSIHISSPPLRRQDTPIKLVFPVQSLPAARAVAQSLGGELNPEEAEWEFQGSRVCDGHDPEGNVFQVRQHAP
jgi:predicted enzyme related to lactoylglutathione lyase